MKFRVHFTTDAGDDSIVVEAEDLAGIRAKADAEVAKRGGRDPWSEPVRE